jgi:hypothetical protein
MTVWHIDDDLMSGYLDGHLSAARVMSVEAHLVNCAPCRARIPADEAWLAASWDQIEDLVDRPRLSPVEWLLGRAVPPHLARLLLATSSLSRAWLVAVLLVLAFAAAAAQLSGTGRTVLLMFLVTAPVLPLVGIALAYGPVVDPAHELVAATPVAGPRLLFVRTSAVLVAAAVLTGLTTPFLPGPLGLSTAWLLPGLMLSVAGLAAGTRFPMQLAAAGLALLWLLAVLMTHGVDPFLVFKLPAQITYACVAALLALVVYARRHRFDSGERT